LTCVQHVTTIPPPPPQSSVVGARKPDLKIYEFALQTLNKQPDQCVFIDDIGMGQHQT
jgi:HAD superfamily hydrolase (TIGR01509 family)